MTPQVRIFALAAAAVLAAGPAVAAPGLGQPAPAFSARDADGRLRSLAEFRGRPVVLEWTNPGCPYVRRHYAGGSMQAAQRQAVAAGAVWLTIASSPVGQQGYISPAAARTWKSANKAGATAILRDPKGVVARAYEARTTPHMFVIDRAGRIAYMGAIDDRPTSRTEDAAGAKNHVLAALADLKAGRAVAEPVTRPYGCAVKYG